jgi:hypothetical protein
MIETLDLSVKPAEAALKNRIRDSDTLMTVVTEDTIVAATEGRIYFLDFDLNFKDAWAAADFLPLGISLDEHNYVYLQVRVGTAVRLWKIDNNAGLLWDIPVPSESAVIFQPPVVAYDHTVYLLSARQVLAIGEDGKVLWKRAGAGPIRGGLVTADNRLLITEGSMVTVFDRAGNREVVYDFGDTLTTPPALTPDGVIYAASRSSLYAIRLSR